MCWKQEWAAAIGNLQYAIKHTERAREKLKKRKERNDATLQRTMEQGHDRFNEARIGELAVKNSSGIEDCDLVLLRLKTTQNILYEMINKYGISRPNMNNKVSGHEENRRLLKLMGGYTPITGNQN